MTPCTTLRSALVTLSLAIALNLTRTLAMAQNFSPSLARNSSRQRMATKRWSSGSARRLKEQDESGKTRQRHPGREAHPGPFNPKQHGYRHLSAPLCRSYAESQCSGQDRSSDTFLHNRKYEQDREPHIPHTIEHFLTLRELRPRCHGAGTG